MIFSLLIIQTGKWGEFWELFFSLNNPLLFIFLFIGIFLVLLFLLMKKIIFPLKRKYRTEIDTLELKHTQMMAQFAELDPEPLCRFDENGSIIELNNPAKQLFITGDYKSIIFSKLFKNINKSASEIIKGNSKIHVIEQIEDKYYSINIVGNSTQSILQVYFHDITERIHAENELTKTREKIKELGIRNENVRDEEGRRIASDLHDGIGQELLFAKLSLGSLEKLDDIGSRRTKISELSSSIDNIVDDLRDICYRLKPKILDLNGLPDAVDMLVSQYNNSSKINGSVNNQAESCRLPSEAELTIYRVLQEAINNIIKHSQANTYEIEFKIVENKFRIIIVDDGKGFNYDKLLKSNSPSLGLYNMQERISNIGGEIKFVSEEAGGTIILININL